MSPQAPFSLRNALQLLLVGNIAGVSAHSWFNWQFDITCESTGHFVPQDETHLVDFVKSQSANKSLLKAVGNGHGFGNLTTCVDEGATDRDSYTISLTNLHSFKVGTNNTVSFGGGWDMVDLVAELKSHGLQLHNTPSEWVQNYIGAATPGSHGTGKNLGNVASHILGVRVLDATGKIHVFDQQNNSDYLKAYKISLGALGLITEVTIQAEPLSYLKRTVEIVPASSNFTELYANIQEYYEAHDRITVDGPTFNYDSTTGNWSQAASLTLKYWEETDVTGVNNCTDYCSNGCGDCSRNFTCYDYAPVAIAVPPSGVCGRGFMGQYEHFVPVEHLLEAGVDFVNFQQAQNPRMEGYPNSMVSYELRFVKGDDAWLSPANTENLNGSYSGVFATFETSWIPSYNDFATQYFYQGLVSEFIPEFGAEYNIRPHWNKGGWFNATYAPTVYPQVQKWLSVQEEMDPDCQFANPFLVNHIGIERCRKAVGA